MFCHKLMVSHYHIYIYIYRESKKWNINQKRIESMISNKIEWRKRIHVTHPS